jgi:hypothetical protein
MRDLRNKGISTKVTADEFDTIASATAGHTLSAWARAVLLEAALAPRADQVLLAEVLALRAIVLHIQVAVNAGETLTTEHLQRLIERADHDKIRKAQERLVSVTVGRTR